MKEVVITHGLRTPIGKVGASLKDIDSVTLGALVMGELMTNRAKIVPAKLDHVILGEVKQSADPSNTARVAALLAGIPETVPAYTVHRQCGSGLQAIIDAYQMIRSDEATAVLAGGVENMSQSVYFMRNTSSGLGSGNYTIEDSLVAGGPGAVPADIYGNQPMGMTAEKLAELYNISRQEEDEFAQLSQERMAAAMAAGRFDGQILPVKVQTKKGEKLFSKDEHPFLSSVESLGVLKPAFKAGGSVTAGNSSGRNDGAAVVLVMAKEKADELGLAPMAR